MTEIRRLLFRGRIVLTILMAALLNATFFYYQCAEHREITLTGDALQDYIDHGYAAFLEQTAKQANVLALLSLTEDADSFAARNIEKTRADYQKLEGVIVETGENRGIAAIGDFGFTDILFAALLLFIAFGFTEESKKGLRHLVRATAKGRGRLTLYRIAASLIGSALLCVLLYGGLLLAAVLSFGDPGLCRAVQSVPELMRCPYPVNIGQYLLFSAAVKCFAGFTVLSLFHLLSCLFPPVPTVLICGAGTAGFCLLYLLVLPTSSVNLLKFANPFALLRTDLFFREYCNLNIFGKPAGMLAVSLVLAGAVLMPAIPATVLAGGRIYDKLGAGLSLPFLQSFRAFLSRKAPQLPLFVWEGIKLLVKQKAALYLAVCFGLALSAALEYRYYYPVDAYELGWHEEYDGVITAELVTSMRDKDAWLEEEIARLEAANPSSPEAMASIAQVLAELWRQKKGLGPVLRQAEDGLAYTLETGRSVWLIKPYAYRLLLRDDEKTTRRGHLFALLAVIAALAGIMACEKQSHMTKVLHSAKRGRRELLGLKLVWTLVVAIVVTLSIHGIQLWQVGKAIPYANPEASVWSLDFLRGFPFGVSLAGYIALLFALRVLVMSLCGLFVGALGLWRSDKVSVMGISVFCLVVPYVVLGML